MRIIPYFFDKMKNKTVIVHFQPIEGYPPAMNIINYLCDIVNIKLIVISTESELSKWFFHNSNASFYRYGKQSTKALIRYFTYLKFNIYTLLKLLHEKPQSIICYETHSIFPVYVYKFIHSNSKIFIHFHEYTSANEINNASKYERYLFTIMKKTLIKSEWISHTNIDRAKLFKLDTNVDMDINIMPNYPSTDWYLFQKNKKDTYHNPVKLIYVGALSLDTMYTKNLCEWIVNEKGKVTLDIYSNNVNQEAKVYLDLLDSPFIKFHVGIFYYDLPTTLIEYDIGIIFYLGHIPNYVYNAPNKLFEYYSCGLDIWISEEMLGSKIYKNESTSPSINLINFNKLEEEVTSRSLLLKRKKCDYKIYCYEDVYSQIAARL
jgi:hypothetical protein